MTIEDKIRNSYFEWMVDLVCRNRFAKEISYRKLLTLLHTIEFRYSIKRDENRAREGINLRYRYSFVNGYDDLSEFIDGPCSVLEMMIALAIKCEEIMNDPAYGDRTGQWFWGMITSLGLGGMYDKNFDKKLLTGLIGFSIETMRLMVKEVYLLLGTLLETCVPLKSGTKCKNS